MKLYTERQMIDYALLALEKLAKLEPNPDDENPLSAMPKLPEPCDPPQTLDREKVMEIFRDEEQTFVFTDSHGHDHPFQGLHHNKYNDVFNAVCSLALPQKPENDDFMYRHTGLESELNLNDSTHDHDHVIVDKEDWEKAKAILKLIKGE